MRAIYYDTETTGLHPEKDRIIEIAAFDPLHNRTFCTFVNPECPIPEESKKITGIQDEMVQDAPKIQQALDSFISFLEGEFILVAHNNDAFDKPFLSAEFQRASLQMPPWKFIDSLKWARKYRPDLPRHTLQFLREIYGIEANQAHRALDDVFVLEKVFSRMIDDLPFPKVLELLAKKGQITRMPFGKHGGKPLQDVPKDYVRWLNESGALDKPDNLPLKEAFIQMGHLYPL